MKKLPQIITSNINGAIIDRAFKLLNELPDNILTDEHVYKFKVNLTDFDSCGLDEKDKLIIKLNELYSLLSDLQKKIIKRLLELSLVNSNIDSVKDKFKKEVEILLRVAPT